MQTLSVAGSVRGPYTRGASPLPPELESLMPAYLIRAAVVADLQAAVATAALDKQIPK